MQTNKIVISTLIGTVLIIAGLVGFYFVTDERGGRTLGGADGKLGGEFTLQSYAGDVALSDFAGKAVILYFGFTNCPEVCPNSLNIIGKTIDMIDAAKRQSVQGVMISIDPKRDDLKTLDDYTRYFHPQILGVTGSDNQLKSVADDYGVFFEVDDLESSEEYVFTHTSRYYVIDTAGNLVDAMRHSTTANELAARIRQIL